MLGGQVVLSGSITMNGKCLVRINHDECVSILDWYSASTSLCLTSAFRKNFHLLCPREAHAIKLEDLEEDIRRELPLFGYG